MAGTAFNAVLNNVARDRHFGGTDASIVADPYISGYHYIKWAKIPTGLSTWLPAGDGKIASSSLSGNKVAQFLESSCLSVTPPGGTLNKTEFTGIGGIKWSVPTNIDYGNSVTIKFLEFSHLPVLTTIHAWVRMIRDMKTGVSALRGRDDSYTKSEYTGTLFYWTTKPDGKTVEYSACYTGVFPTKDPQDMFSGDLTAVDKLEIDIDFNVDWIWHEAWVHDKCQGFANQIKNNPADGHRGTITGARNGTDPSAAK